MDRCDACAFVYDDVATDEIAPRLAAFGPGYRAVVAPVTLEALRMRPDDTTWSPLEYVCHVRDVFVVQHERLILACELDTPEFIPMGREERAVDGRYNEQDPDLVLDELEGAAHALAAAFAALVEPEWNRVGIYNWPERAERTMTWLGRHTIHEGTHHLRDVERQLASDPT